ncbi:MAG: hypothetical protein QNJ68_00760 [Microcoleaceae cyanobacterium MO_207.B10]|nr:hypothetical protein [Microcoleaceae cyanobacterium MO_207.B10]
MIFNYRIFWTTILIIANLLTTNSIVLAETKQTSQLIDSNNNNSYKVLVKQAEDLVKNIVNQEFKNNPQITEVTVTILGERQSQIVPVLRLTVSRSEWQNNPDIDEFTRYFADAKFLLKFDNNSTTTSDSQPKTPNSSPQSPVAPPPPPSDSRPIVPQPSKRSNPSKSNSSPRFPTDADDSGEIDD